MVPLLLLTGTHGTAATAACDGSPPCPVISILSPYEAVMGKHRTADTLGTRQ